MYQKVVNMYEWEGTAGKPAVKGNNGAAITLENLADFDVRQTDSAVEYNKQVWPRLRFIFETIADSELLI
jgi:arylsulfatase